MISKYFQKTYFLPSLISITLFSLPLYIIRCSNFPWCVSPIPFTLLEILIVTTLFVWLYVRLQETKSPKKIFTEIRRRISLKFQLLTAFFLLASFVAVFVSSDPRGALGIYKAYFIEPILLGIVIFDYLVRTKNIKLIIWSLAGSGVWISLLSIIQKTFGFNPGNPLEFFERGRVSAVYSTSNAVGLFIGPIIFILLGYYFLKKEENEKISFFTEKKIILLSILTLLLGQYVSGSRGGYLGLLAGLIFFFGFPTLKEIIEKYLGSVVRFFVIFGGIFLLGNLIFLFNISNFFQFTEKVPTLNNLNGRFCIWEGTSKMLLDRPIFGAGLDGFDKTYPNYRTCNPEEPLYPHHILFNFWSEVGLFGLISFILLGFLVFSELINLQEKNYLVLGVASALVEILFHGLFDVPYFKNDLSVLFWLILVLGIYLIYLEKGTIVRRLQNFPHRQ